MGAWRSIDLTRSHLHAIFWLMIQDETYGTWQSAKEFYGRKHEKRVAFNILFIYMSLLTSLDFIHWLVSHSRQF